MLSKRTDTGIEATAQQSRFHSATLDATTADIDLYDVSLVVGERGLLSGARVYLKDGTRYGLIGRNGSGKSTLLHALVNRLIPGIAPSIRITLVSQIEERSGDAPEAVGRTVIEQVMDLYTERKVLLEEQGLLEKALDLPDLAASQTLLSTLLVHRAERELEEANRTAQRRSGARGKKAREEEIAAEARVEEARRRLAEGKIDPDCSLRITSLLGDVQLSLELMESDTFESRAKVVLLGLGFSEGMITGPYASLSGGWRSRCRLGLALLVPSDVLLLDEPSNFMDLESIVWFQGYLAGLSQTVVVTSHDQSFLDAVSQETIALRHENLSYFPGTPSAMMEDERKERLGKVKQQAALDKKREHIEASIAEGRRTAKKTADENRARMVKSRNKKLNDRWGAETSAKGTRFKLNRDLAGYHLTSREAIDIQDEESEVRLRLPDAAGVKLSGNLVVIEGLAAGYGEKDVLSGVDLVIGQRDRVALVGRNGQGKSTLAKVLTGELKPRKGKVERHTNLKLGYFDQHSVERLSDKEDTTPLQAFLAHAPNLPMTITEAAARSFLGRFGLGGRLASHTPISRLSGGQRVRLALALLFFDPPNLLLLDEVTTHLDITTIRALGRALRKWTGALVLITHDRSFCNLVMGHATSEDESDESEGEDVSPSRVFHVRKGGLKLLDGGMTEYERLIEKRLAKRSRK